MTYLIDTHALIWFSLDDPRLDPRIRTLIEGVDDVFLVSPASFWEIAIKVSIGKLPLIGRYEEFVARCLEPDMFQLLPIEPAHTTQLASLPFPRKHHKDPFDRLLIAQAMVEGVPIVGADAAFDAYPVRRIW